MRPWLVVCSVVVFAVAGAQVGRADVAPPDACTSPGQPCQTAGPQYDQPGICTAAICTKYMRSPDGGGTTMRYNCHLCEVSDAGIGAGVAGAGGGTGVAGAGGGGIAGAGGGGIAGAGGGQATGGSPGMGGAAIRPNCCGGGSTACAVAPGDGDRHGVGALGLLAAIGLTVFLRRRPGSTKHAAD